jgi:hypothetical protein
MIDIQNLFAELVKREPDHVEVTAFDALDQGSTSSLKTKKQIKINLKNKNKNIKEVVIVIVNNRRIL